ncbi:hypothetical protein ACFWOB_16570 [Streptomyces sp. NPDC058420]|uniref:hypothetical protein n=1 Tax=Streptomyces sp. NPDC058420 TaxID=3346489 RepID=UPI00365C1412
MLSILTPEGRANPCPALAELRRTEPVCHHAGFNTYFLTRFPDRQAVLTDPEFHGTDHARLRRLAGGAFSARRVAALRPTVRDITARLLNSPHPRRTWPHPARPAATPSACGPSRNCR